MDLSESPRTDFGRVEFDKQSQVQRVFSAIWALESKVNSGGFSHYLTCEEKETVPFAPTALRAIGALRCAAIVDKALLMEPSGDYLTLDEEFMAYPDNLTDLLFEYVVAHPESFGSVEEAC